MTTQLYYFDYRTRHMLGALRQLGITTANQTYLLWKGFIDDYYNAD